MQYVASDMQHTKNLEQKRVSTNSLKAVENDGAVGFERATPAV